MTNIVNDRSREPPRIIHWHTLEQNAVEQQLRTGLRGL